MKFLSIITLSTLLLIGCTKTEMPVSRFTWDGDTTAPTTIYVESYSLRADRHMWTLVGAPNFTFLDDQPPKYSFKIDKPGTYEITLRVINSAGYHESSKFITIK